MRRAAAETGLTNRLCRRRTPTPEVVGNCLGPGFGQQADETRGFSTGAAPSFDSETDEAASPPSGEFRVGASLGAPRVMQGCRCKCVVGSCLRQVEVCRQRDQEHGRRARGQPLLALCSTVYSPSLYVWHDDHGQASKETP